MASTKTLNFLPSVFQSDTNQKFLNATLDQLVTPPELRNINGYIGRKFAPTFKNTDNYQPELTNLRQNYQLEPSVVVKNAAGNIDFFSSYIDLLQQIEHYGGITNNQDRLFRSESYNFDGLFDFDKFVNFIEYYWLPNGPDEVQVFSSELDSSFTYYVTRDSATGSYYFTNKDKIQNPTLKLAYGGTYKFIVDQPGFPFWIQTEPGISGTKVNQSNFSTRNILGIENNGIDSGTITFTVPAKSSQDWYLQMPLATSVDLSTTISYKDLHGQTLSSIIALYGGLDGISSQLPGKTFIFVNNDIDDTQWTVNGRTVPIAERRNAWVIRLEDSNVADPVIKLETAYTVNTNERVFVRSGVERAEQSYYLNSDTYTYSLIPPITAPLSELYYQDGKNSGFSGLIQLAEISDKIIKVDEEIVGRTNYISPNGVTFTNGLKITFDTNVTPSTYANNTYYVEGVGTSIKLLKETYFKTAENYVETESTQHDYITINRASIDRNAWSRSNRWFHIDVITATANYNNSIPVFDQSSRATRPVIEFEANLHLFNFGRVAVDTIDIIDFEVEDALSTIELSGSAEVDGVTLTNGMRVIFAGDTDPTVRNKVWTVGINSIDGDVKITLSLADDYEIFANNNLIVTGGTNTGKEFYFDGSNWIEGQTKTQTIQEPLFDVIDQNGYSLGDTSVYPDSTFAGTKIFSYQRGTGSDDAILGFPLSYRNFNQIGDIQFDNNFDSETFTYTTASGTTTENINIGVVPQIVDLTSNTLRNTWTTNGESTKQFQIISNVYDGLVRAFEIDITENITVSVPNFRVYKNSQLLASTKYQLVNVGIKKYININDTTLTKGDRIDVLIYSDTVSALGYYEVPKNLDLNTENANFSSLTLGQLRNHLYTMAQNSTKTIGQVPGNSNLRDVPIKTCGGSIIQHASPVIYSELFLVDPDLNFMKGIELARHEYSKIKNKLLELSQTAAGVDINDIPTTLDVLLKLINKVKNKSFAWYYSDMVPYGDIKTTLQYTVLSPQIRGYEITNIFDVTELSNSAVLVYVNNKLLLRDRDFVFDTTRAGVTIADTFDLQIGDIIHIHEYTSTDGNYIPETPTKLGLFPKFKPAIFVDNTYQEPITVIQGHDGSITPAFGDFRDDLLLEFETRIYNNIKVDYAKNAFNMYDYLPGKFRTQAYNLTEFNRLLTQSFLGWAGNNRVDFTTNQYFSSSNPWTWNYRLFSDTINGEKLPGSWRSIFKYFYDTDRPHTHPWEMLGFSEQPTWWEDRYGPAPYTGGNLVLWGDLAKGYIFGEDRYDTCFVRPDLLKIIPVTENGELRSPTEFATANFNSNDANTSFMVGDQGPVETAWRRSSEFPYAMQEAIALSNPAFYFGTLMNIGRYYKNTDLNQYIIKDSLQRITPNTIVLNGDDRTLTIGRAAGYLNWILDYLRNKGIDPAITVGNYLENVNVQLAYKMAGFSDKKLFQVIAEQSSPTSTNQGVIIPAENYNMHLYKSTPTKTISYSAVIVEKSENGYTVSGYNTDDPYFTIIPSLANNNAYAINVLDDTAVIYNDFQQYKVTVPYGFEFVNKQQLVDFLVSYERYLLSQGMTFNEFDADLELLRDWKLSVREFLSWTQQGWDVGSILVLSPTLNKLTVNTIRGIIDEVENQPGASRLVDANFNFIKSNKFSVIRDDNRFVITANLEQTIALAILNVVEYEHVIIFDNATVFNDIIYKPELGNRQYRLKLIGKKSGGWTGNLNPPGFIYNSPDVDEWVPGRDYLKGTLVSYKTLYFTALDNLIASEEFQSAYWKQVTLNEIKSGLLPNFSYNAEKFNRFNDIDNPETEGDFDQYSNGTIGFRPRDYLTDFGINTTTQAKFYQGFIKEKGTINAVNAFTAAGFNGVTSNIDIYEEWAMRVGEYGALDNNKFVEVTLTEGLFTSDPATFTLLPTNGTSVDKIIGIQPDELYRVSSSMYNPEIYNNRDDSSIYENDIHTAGYVNALDVDGTVFDIANYDELNRYISTVNVGFKIWCAKDFNDTWNVYRVNDTNLSVVQMDYATDDKVTITINKPHGLITGDLVVVKGFADGVDSFYRVSSVGSAFKFNATITLGLTELKARQTITSVGALYKLQSVRISKPTDINTITPPQNWTNDDKLWIDNNGNGTWAVYSKSTPWSANLDINYSGMILDANSYVSNSGFGTVATINEAGTFVAAGIPGVLNGNVMAFVSNVTNGNTFTLVANIGTTDAVTNFGVALDSAGNLLYVGAPGNGTSNSGAVFVYEFDGNVTFTEKQTITSHWPSAIGDQFGYSVSASDDGQWLFVGAPNKGNVEVYSNIGGVYTYDNTIIGDSTAKFGYNVKTTADASQTIISAPYETVNDVSAAGAVYVYDRSIETFIADGSTTYTTQYPAYSANVKITVNGNVLASGAYVVNGTTTVSFVSAPEVGNRIDIETNKIQELEKITAPVLSSGATFGITSHISGNDIGVYIGSPGYSEPGYFSGLVYRLVNQGAVYGDITSTIFDPVVNVGDSLRINGQLVTFGANTVGSLVGNLQSITANINSANITGVTATATDYGLLQITSNSTVTNNKLSISSGNGTALTDIGLSVYLLAQTLRHPGTDDVNQFGSQITSSIDANTLVISATGGTTYNSLTVDQGATVLDAGSTEFLDPIEASGVTYVYSLVGEALSGTVNDQYVLTQRLENRNLSQNDKFGSSLTMNQNTILIGAPGDSSHAAPDIISESMVAIPNAGTYYVYENVSGNIGWDIIRAQESKVDTDSIDRLFLYNNVTNTILTNLDFVDPAKGKVLGVADQFIDYRTVYDPAVYNVAGGTDENSALSASADYHWGASQVGLTWWNLDKVRYVDYEQGNLITRSASWGNTFPGSEIAVYEWVESDDIPSQYAGSGTAVYADNSAYCIQSYVDPSNKIVRTKYYFWVKDKTTVDVDQTYRTIAVSTLQDIIANPAAQGIPYATVLRNDTISLHGINEYLMGNTTVLHVDYDTLKNTNVIHSEYQLVQEGNENSKIPERIVTQLKSSLSGINTAGNPIPDTSLAVQNQIGLGRGQTLFVNRLVAVKNFVEFVNTAFMSMPVAEEFNIDGLYSAESHPTAEEYNITVSTRAELDYINVSSIDVGYVVLVINDETQRGLWALYTYNGVNQLGIAVWENTQTQSYHTPFYWDKIDWYDTTYDYTVNPTQVVETKNDLLRLSMGAGDTVKVRNNGRGQFEVYRYTSATSYSLVGIENGTIQLNSKLYNPDVVAGTETGIIFDVLRNDIFVKTLSAKFNQLIFFLINYILTEQKSVDWVFKTSFVSVMHQLRKLEQFPNYIKDNQDYYESYINEVKPYRTSLREYLLDYQGSDLFGGDVTDFDLPADYSAYNNTYRSPDGTLSTDANELSTRSEYSQWYNNHAYGISKVEVTNGGIIGNTQITTITTVDHSNGFPFLDANDLVLQPVTGASGRVYISSPGPKYSLQDTSGEFADVWKLTLSDDVTLTTSSLIKQVITASNVDLTPNVTPMFAVISSNEVFVHFSSFENRTDANIYIDGVDANVSVSIYEDVGYLTSNGANTYVTVTDVVSTYEITGYTTTPNVTVVGGGGSGAIVEAVVDTGFGNITSFNVINPGSGYTSTPTIVINGTGQGARGYPYLSNKYYVDSIPTQDIRLESNVVVEMGDVIFQPNTDAQGTVYKSTTGDIITLVDIAGTFASNHYIFNNGANLVTRVGQPTQSITLDSNITVYTGNVITQPNANASGIVQASVVSNVIDLIDVNGEFSTNPTDWVFNTGVNTESNITSISSYLGSNSITSYTQFVPKSYNLVRTFDSTIKFDRVSYTSNILTWEPNVKITTLTLTSEVAVSEGDLILQANGGATARAYISSVSNVIVVNDVVGDFVLDSPTHHIYAGNVYTGARSNLQVRVESAVESPGFYPTGRIVSYNGSAYQATSDVYSQSTIKLSSNITATSGDYITQYTGNAQLIGSVVNSNLITVGNISGEFRSRSGNLSVNGTDTNAIVLNVNNVFDYSKYTEINSADFDNANDRIMSYYSPTESMIAKDLKKLVHGIEYPGVIVEGVQYDAITSTISTNVISLQSEVSTLHSSNVEALNFNTLGYSSGLPIVIKDLDTGYIGNLIIVNFTSNTMLVSGNVSTITNGANVVLQHYDFENPLYLDSIMQSQYRDSSLGIRPEDIIIDGNGYIDTFSSHAPEELVPGAVFDNLNIIVTTQMYSNTQSVSYRIEHTMQTDSASLNSNVWPKYYTVDPKTTTTLTANLSLSDSVMYVDDASVLLDPNPDLAIPGIVYINGEKIYFYTRDTENNILGNLRRAVDGTGAPSTHISGSKVIQASNAELLPEDISGVMELRSHTGTWLNPVAGFEVGELVTNFEESIVDNLNNEFITGTPGFDAVTDGSGLEGSRTIQAEFIKRAV